MATDTPPPGPDTKSGSPVPSVRTTFQRDLATACGIGPGEEVELGGGAAAGARTAPTRGPEHGVDQLRYAYVDDVGKGGMGAVYRVFDRNLRRTLALKVIRERRGDPGDAGARASRELSSRFLEEAQITAQLEHPGVVPVYDLGLDETSQLYFTMRLVRGRTLEDVFDLAARGAEGWNRTRALGVLLKVCEAMSYAHDKGVIHRDLKPANVMVGRYGEVYVVDWGLARVEGREDARDLRPSRGPDSSMRTGRRDVREQDHDSPLVTMDGTIVGTPYFMSREQAVGRTDLMGPRSDVYAVGAMLYHLLAGRMPYHEPGDTPSPHTVLAMVIQGPPRPVAELAPDVPPELAAICERAMARELDQRYPDMGALAEDLRAFLEGRVVRAYETGAWAELKKWVRRNRPLAAALLTTVFLALGGLAAVGVVEARGRANQEALNEELRAANVGLAAERATSERVVDFLIEMFRQEDPRFSRGATITVKEVLDREAARIRAQLTDEPEFRARLMAAMGEVYQSLGLYDQARPLVVEALAETDRRLGADDPRTWSAQSRLGSVLMDLDAHDEARPLLEGVLARSEEALGLDHPDTLQALYLLGTLSYHQGRESEAEGLLEQALVGQERMLGDDDPATLRTQLNLAALQVSANRLTEAAERYRAIVRALVGRLGEDDPTTLFAQSNLAFVLLEMGEVAEAESVCAEVLDRRVRVLGRDHPETLTSLHNLALVHFQQGRADEAEQELREAWKLRRGRLGEDDPQTLLSLSSLAYALRVRGALDPAQELLEGYLEPARRVLSGADPALLDALQFLAERYRAQGREDEARALAEELEARSAAAGR